MQADTSASDTQALLAGHNNTRHRTGHNFLFPCNKCECECKAQIQVDTNPSDTQAKLGHKRKGHSIKELNMIQAHSRGQKDSTTAT